MQGHEFRCRICGNVSSSISSSSSSAASMFSFIISINLSFFFFFFFFFLFFFFFTSAVPKRHTVQSVSSSVLHLSSSPFLPPPLLTPDNFLDLSKEALCVCV